MRLQRLSLTNFRNFARLTLDFPRPITLLQGDNAQGKTNLLEAIYYLATSRSPRASTEREVVNWLAFKEPLPFARLEADLAGADFPVKLEIILTRQANQTNNVPRFSKQIRINGVARRAFDLVGHLPVVLFLPQDIHLVTGPPAGRRRYLDATLCQMDTAYCRTLMDYSRVLTQRNALLRDLRERGNRQGGEQLRFWDEQLVTLGSRLTVRRAALLSALDEEANRQHRVLSGGRERLRLRYTSGITDRLPAAGQQLALDLEGIVGPPSADVDQVVALFQEGLDALRRREVAAGMSLLGPHRDDVRFLSEGRDLQAYGSRGQQRTATLALKLAEVAVMGRELGQPPLLLLDDIMSELDGARRQALLTLLSSIPQAIVTATDWEDFSPAFRAQARQLRVVEGRIEEIVA
ncbi:MAG: DNA replication/repair protein RecF [Anaerolineae bacterium]|nr:DNA replication/repair protein RecF [Anaerolineae bacterium]